MKITNQQQSFYEKALLYRRDWGRLLLIFSVVWAVESCRKDPNEAYIGRFYSEGTVFEKGKLRTPVEGVQVMLLKVTGTEPFSGSVSFRVVDSTTTDKSGFYRLNVVADPSASYYLTPKGDPTRYWNRSAEPVEGDVPNPGKKNVTNLFIYTYGYVQVYVKNTSPVDEKDQIGIGGSWGRSISDNVNYFGKNVDESFVRKVFANDSTRVFYEVEKTNSPLLYKNKFYFLTSKDTLKVNINY